MQMRCRDGQASSHPIVTFHNRDQKPTPGPFFPFSNPVTNFLQESSLSPSRVETIKMRSSALQLQASMGRMATPIVNFCTQGDPSFSNKSSCKLGLTQSPVPPNNLMQPNISGFGDNASLLKSHYARLLFNRESQNRTMQIVQELASANASPNLTPQVGQSLEPIPVLGNGSSSYPHIAYVPVLLNGPNQDYLGSDLKSQDFSTSPLT